MKKYALVIGLAGFLVGCSTYQKAVKSEDTEHQLTVANQLYEEGDFRRAANLYELIEKNDGWKQEREEMFVNYATALNKRGKYELVAPVTQRFNLLFPNSVFKEQMLYMNAKSLYNQSEDYSTDQHITLEAIEQLDEFTRSFPNSSLYIDAQKMKYELNTRLEKKAYENAKLYNTIGEYTRDYNAAIVALDIFLRDYPSGEFKEDAMYYKFDAAYKLAINSIYGRMEERLEQAINYYNQLISYNENTKYKEEADEQLERLERELTQFTKTK